jgi:hypothetical protein
MKLHRFLLLCAIVTSTFAVSWGQTSEPQPLAAAPGNPVLATTQKSTVSTKADNSLKFEIVESSSEMAEAIAFPECDGDGNLYFTTAPDGVHAIHKVNQRGQRVAVFLPNSPGVRVDFPQNFAIAPSGDIYQLIHAHETTRYVFVYKPDGGLKSTIKLEQGSAFDPSIVAVFATGDLLVSGLEHDKDHNNPTMWPFTRIFSSDGTLRKSLALEDDEQIHDMAASGDPRVRPADRPSYNHAVSWGAAETGGDGNVYLMRRLSPAILYAISPSGAVRRFTVDPGRPDFMPAGMHVGGDRIAVLFWHPQTDEEILKVVDLKGHTIATYDEPVVNGQRRLGLAFTCYARNPDRFTFLETADDHKIELITATPQ